MIDKRITESAAQLRRELHAHPELSGQERATYALIDEWLRRNTALQIFRFDGWLCALRREPGATKTIAFRADVDAIPDGAGKPFHGCGHDGHAAALCGAAAALSASNDALGRNIVLIFQPAEETGAGAARVVSDLAGCGELPAIDEIYGCHNLPGVPLGRVLLREGVFACASLGLHARVTGRQSHAAYPEEGLNPGYALATAALGIGQTAALFAQRSFIRATLVGLRCGGMNYGVSPGEGELGYTLRAEREETLEELTAAAERAFDVVRDTGFDVELERYDVFPATLSDDGCVRRLRALLTSRGFDCAGLDMPMRWSEDFGNYMKAYKGAFFGLGSGEALCGLHTDGYEYPDSLLSTAIDCIVTICREI